MAKYKCYYTGKPMTVSEIKEIDERIESLDEETWECVMESLPTVKREYKHPYIHRSRHGYPVYNMCKGIFNKALQDCSSKACKDD